MLSNGGMGWPNIRRRNCEILWNQKTEFAKSLLRSGNLLFFFYFHLSFGVQELTQFIYEYFSISICPVDSGHTHDSNRVDVPGVSRRFTLLFEIIISGQLRRWIEREREEKKPANVSSIDWCVICRTHTHTHKRKWRRMRDAGKGQITSTRQSNQTQKYAEMELWSSIKLKTKTKKKQKINTDRDEESDVEWKRLWLWLLLLWSQVECQTECCYCFSQPMLSPSPSLATLSYFSECIFFIATWFLCLLFKCSVS